LDVLKLYYAPGACSIVSHIVLEETGAKFAAIAVDFAKLEHRQPAFLRINPKGRVPALVTDRGVVTESPAIVLYLSQLYPDSGLAPLDDPFALAQMQALNIYIATTIHITFRQISVPGVYADGEVAQAALRAKVPGQTNIWFSVLEEKLADGRPYLLGDTYSTSDPYLYAFASYLSRGDRGDPALFPNVQRHRERIAARPAVRRVIEREGLGEDWWRPA
jgi:glutathione S-transferase